MNKGKYMGGIRTISDVRDRCRIDVSGCWCWALSINQGAPRIHFVLGGEKYTQRGPRAVKMIQLGGELPKGMVCFPKPDCLDDCVNPDHVCVGDRKAGGKSIAVRGMVKNLPSKIASAKRAGAHRRKLTPEQVAEVRHSPESNRALAKRLGVSNYAIWSIRVGKSWRMGAANSSVFNWRPAA